MELKVENLGYEVRGKRILGNISFSVGAGEMVGLWGSSGAGKTTLLLALRGILQQYDMGRLQGQVLFDGRNLAAYAYPQLGREIGLLFQQTDMQLFSATVYDEVAFGLENFCVPAEEIACRVSRVLEALGLSGLADTSPRKLSGGQKKLVVLGSLLVLAPKILLLDEPLASLDALERNRILCLLEELKNGGMSIVLVEHDWEAARFVDRMLFLAQGNVLAEKQRTEIFTDRALLERCGILPPPMAIFLEAMGLPPADFFSMGQCWNRLKGAGYLA